MFRKVVAFVSVLLLLGACQLPSSDPPAQTPSLTITPASININAGDAPATFVAAVQNSTEAVTWVYTGPGSITPSAGPVTTYTPPESVDSVQSGSLTATLGATGVTAVAPIAIYPADVTPPPDPPDPPDPGPDPDPDPDPGPDPGPDPDPDPPADLSVSIANVDPVTLGEGGTASVNLNASTSNAPGGTTYQWTAQGDNAGNVTFSSPTSEDTTATFSAEGTYRLRLTATSGSQSDSDTVDVTVNPAPQTVEGVWDATFDEGGTAQPFTLDLEQSGEDVTGTWTYAGADYPATGTFDGTNLELESLAMGQTIAFDATVTGNSMSGTIANEAAGVSYPFTATREAAP